MKKEISFSGTTNILSPSEAERLFSGGAAGQMLAACGEVSPDGSLKIHYSLGPSGDYMQQKLESALTGLGIPIECTSTQPTRHLRRRDK